MRGHHADPELTGTGSFIGVHIFTARTASTFTNNGGSKEGRGFGEGTWLWARVGVEEQAW